MDDDGADRRRDTYQAGVPPKDPRTIARKYQLELCRRAVEENIIVYLGTGCGKTHIAVLLIYELRHLFEKPNEDICVFLAPSVPLVQQQTLVIKNSTDLKVGAYSGESKHLKSHAAWEKAAQDHEVLVMTPQILLQNLRHCFIRMEQVALLIFDECHHAQLQKRHPYAQIMKEFYGSGTTKCPRIFGMTASPIMGKGGFDPLNYTKCINSLENLLNSKVCSVDDDSELESIVASPNVKMVFYEPASSGGENSISAYTTKLKQLKDNSVSVVRKNNANIDDCERKMKLLSRVHENVLFCLETIGLCGAIQAARIISASDDKGSLRMENGTRVGNDEAKQHLDQIVSILNGGILNDGSLLAAPLEEPFFSKKLCALIGVLQRYRDNPNAKCIIFVKRIIIAKSLAWILKNLTTLGFWKCEFLVGFHSGSMSRSKMNNIVEIFCSGEVNLLVATNVAEEGLDIPTCCLVIRFDLPETVASFIQSRGRARMSKSEYVFLVERGNLREEKLLENFRCGEDVMNKEITYRTSSEIFSHLDEATFKVDTTGASISTGCSVSLLHHYCSKLPHDRFYKPAPKFFYFDDLNGTICKIILPSNCPIRQVESLPFYSKDEAKRAACLKACEELHTLGALSDFLLPNIGDKDKQESRTFELEKDESTREELHEMLMPNVIQGLNSHFRDQLSLHFYQLNFVPIPEDRKYKKFGVFFRTYLPKEAETSELDLHLALGRMVKTSLVPSGVIIFTKEEVMLAQNFQEMFLKIILDRSEFMSNVVQLGAESAAIHAPTFYLLLPIVQHVYDEKMSIDWGTVKLCLSSPIFSNPLDPIGRDLPLSDSSKTLILANGLVRKEDVVKSLVFNPDRKVFYFIEDILYDMNANSVMIGCKKLSYVEHYTKKFNIDLRYPEQPLFKAKRLFCARNLLYNRLSANTVVPKKEEHFVELPPELCLLKIIGFSNEVGSSLSLLPSFMHRLEKLLVAIELKHVLSVSFSEALEISASRILEALTTEKCLERFSLERLEVLGDAFLKFVAARHSFVSYQSLDEGQLTQKRSRLVSNSNLHVLAVAKGLQVYIYDEVFEPENFFALGRPCMIPCNHNTESGAKMSREADSGTTCSKSHRWLQMKTIADVVEALIGAFLVDSGFKGAISFLKWIGIEVGYEGSNIQRICNESCNNLSVAYKLDISYIEKVLGYSFQYEGLLVQAFIHPSYIKHSGGCYQRLEFLGDAVLEYLVTSYLYSTYPMLKPGQLTDLKSLIVSNNSFARIAVQKGLHKYIIADCQATMEAINIFGRYIIQEDNQRDLIDEPHCPKVLGDVVESCIGAILLDSGFDMNRIWDTMMVFLGSALIFSNFHVSCIRELLELCQFCGFQLSFPEVTKDKGEYLVKVDVNMEGRMLHSSASNVSSKAAKRLVSQEMLTKLKDLGHKHKRKSLEEVLRDTKKEEGKLIGFDEKPVSLVDVSTRLDGLKLNDSEEASSSAIPDRTMVWRNLPQTNDFSQGTIMNRHAKSRLLELCVVNHWIYPLFECCKEEGQSHLKMFTYKVTVLVPGIHNTLLECFGDPHRKKKAAQEHAAEGALWYLKNVGYV